MSALIHPRAVADLFRVGTSWFNVYLNPKVSGVCLPRHLYDGGTVMLQIGDRLAKPIPNLTFDDYGFSGTLSFAGVNHRTLVPWHAVEAMEVPPDGLVIAWRKTTIEMSEIVPDWFPGREKDGAGYWCPRRQRVVHDCNHYHCAGADCAYKANRGAARVNAGNVVPLLRVIEGGAHVAEDDQEPA